MKKANIFLDSNALMSAIISKTGAAHVLLQLGEDNDIVLIVSELVIAETTYSIAKKSPENLGDVQKEITKSRINVILDPPDEEIHANLYLISDPDDVPILLAAMKAKVDYLATHDRRHFLDDPKVAENSGLKIGTPGDVLAWVRENLNPQE
jgi:predicted nucleic acid-binding protein